MNQLSAMERVKNARFHRLRQALQEIVKKGEDKDEAGNPLQPRHVRAKVKDLFEGVRGSWFRTTLRSIREENEDNGGFLRIDSVFSANNLQKVQIDH